jgi:cation:H+ antiporter
VSAVLAPVLLIAGVVLVVAGAELFFTGLLATAARLRVAPFAITVLVSGLELENLAAGIAANAKGLPGAAAGTFLGGTTFLALAVAGVAALIAPMRARVPGAVYLWTALAPVPLVLLSIDGELSRPDGAALVIWFAVAIAALARTGWRLGSPEQSASRKRGALVRLVAGLGVLTAGGDILGEGIQRTVSRLGVSQTLLGNTALAASVEAEEIARVAVPARRARADVGFANVCGTIVHFIALNAGVIALVRPLPLDSDSLHLHLPVAAGSAALMAGLAWRGGGLGRVVGGLLVSLYAAYIAVAIVIAG